MIPHLMVAAMVQKIVAPAAVAASSLVSARLVLPEVPVAGLADLEAQVVLVDRKVATVDPVVLVEPVAADLADPVVVAYFDPAVLEVPVDQAANLVMLENPQSVDRRMDPGDLNRKEVVLPLEWAIS